MAKRNVIILFFFSVICGYAIWHLSPLLFGTREAWDGQGWYMLALGALGFSFGIAAIERPWIWPLGIYLGELIWGVIDFVSDIVAPSGRGFNFFIPIGAIILLIYSFPVFVGSYLGFYLRKELLPSNNPDIASKYAALKKGRDEAIASTPFHDGVPASRTTCDVCGTVYPSHYYLRAAGSSGYICIECSKKA